MPTLTVQHASKSSKDNKDPLSVSGNFYISCSCGRVYNGTTKKTINMKLSQHKRDCRLGHIQKSALAEYAFRTGHHKIFFEEQL